MKVRDTGNILPPRSLEDGVADGWEELCGLIVHVENKTAVQ